MKPVSSSSKGCDPVTKVVVLLIFVYSLAPDPTEHGGEILSTELAETSGNLRGGTNKARFGRNCGFISPNYDFNDPNGARPNHERPQPQIPRTPPSESLNDRRHLAECALNNNKNSNENNGDDKHDSAHQAVVSSLAWRPNESQGGCSNHYHHQRWHRRRWQHCAILTISQSGGGEATECRPVDTNKLAYYGHGLGSHKPGPTSSQSHPSTAGSGLPRWRWRWPSLGLIKAVAAIRLIRLDVSPHSIHEGQEIKLRCLYETRGDKLQSLSWYKNGREFYRFQPFERRQPVLAFETAGVHVDISRSKSNTVYMTNTTLETSGRYKCEATGTTFQEANMEKYIEVLPSSSSPGAHVFTWLTAFVMYITLTHSAYLLFCHTYREIKL